MGWIRFIRYNYNGRSFVHKNDEQITFQGTHPVVYVALALHGLYARPSRIVYLRYLFGAFELADHTSDDGAELKAVKNLRIKQAQNA